MAASRRGTVRAAWAAATRAHEAKKAALQKATENPKTKPEEIEKKLTEKIVSAPVLPALSAEAQEALRIAKRERKLAKKLKKQQVAGAPAVGEPGPGSWD